MGFEGAVGSISIGVSALAAVLNSALLPLFLVVTVAFLVDGLEMLLRLRAFHLNKPAIAEFRHTLSENAVTADVLDVSVILPIFKRPKELKKCIEHLFSAGIPKEKILVVDDFSNDEFETANIAASYGLRVVSISRNTKKVGAVELGIKLANSKYVVLLDADSLLISDYNRIKEAILEMEILHIDAMAGKVLPYLAAATSSAKSRLLFELQHIEYEQAMQLGRGAMYKLGKIEETGEINRQNTEAKRAQVINVSGAFGIFRTQGLLKALSTYQSIEENFNGEDIERTFKVLATHGKVGYSDNLLISTAPPSTLKNHFKQRLSWSEGFFRCFCSRFGAGICKKKTSASVYTIHLFRDILLHPLKLLFLPLLFINLPLFLTLLGFYTILSILVSVYMRNGASVSKKAILLLPLYRLYILMFPTTIGYGKGLLHATKVNALKLAGKISIRPVNIAKTWNLTSETTCPNQ